MMNNEEILKRVIKLLETMKEPENEVTADSELIEDLGISSMDIVFLITNLEEEFEVKVPVSAIRKMVTIADVVDVVTELIDK